MFATWKIAKLSIDALMRNHVIYPPTQPFMKRKLLFTPCLLLFATSTPVWGNPIDAESARRLALQHIQQPVALNTPRALIKAKKGKGTAPSQQPAYYLFNNADGKGFAIVAGDDRLGRVIGYSPTCHLQPDSITPPLQALLDTYAQAAELIRVDSISLPPKYTQLPKAKVDPLLDCEWNQDYPYNLYTPTRLGKKTPIGCVAAALSQLLYYHKWPKERNENMEHGTEAQALNYYDWEAMLPNYNHASTSYQASAVATLTRDVGLAAKMTYGTEGSWSDEGKAWYALENTFGYSVRYIEKDVMPVGEYMQTLYNELSMGNPIFIIGGDHAFVYDGYDENGLIHANWGWGGKYNGFYDINIVSITGNPYTNGKFYYKQKALLARPKDGHHELFTEQPIVLTIDNSNGLIIKEKSCPRNGQLTAEMTEVVSHNLAQGTDYAYTGDLGVGLFNEQGKCLHVFESPYGTMQFTSYYNKWNLNSTSSPWLLNFANISHQLPNGRYYLRPMCHRQLNELTNEWESWRIMYNANTVWLTINDDTVTPDDAVTHANIEMAEAPDVLVPLQANSGEICAIAVKVKNNTHFDARAHIKAKFIGLDELQGEVYDVPQSMTNDLYLAQRNSTSTWMVRFGTSYVNATSSGAMKPGRYALQIEATYPNGDDYFEDEVNDYITTTLTWPNYAVEVLSGNYKGFITIPSLTVYNNNEETQTSVFDPRETTQIGFAIQSKISAMRDDWFDTQVRYQIKDLTTGSWAYTSQPLQVRLPYGQGDVRQQTRCNLPLEELPSGRSYEVHVEVFRDGTWYDLWNSNSARRQFSVNTTNPVIGAENVVGGFASADYQLIKQQYEAYAALPTADAYQSLSTLITQSPRIMPESHSIYYLRNKYADNGTLYLTAEDSRLIGQTFATGDRQQQFCLVPGVQADSWHIYNMATKMYVAQLPEAGEDITLVADAAQAAEFRLNTSLADYTTSIIAIEPTNASFPAIRLGKRNRIQAWATQDESSLWYLECTGLKADIEGDITGLHATTSNHDTTTSTQYFDLQGRRLQHLPQHGIVISTQGKKVVR